MQKTTAQSSTSLFQSHVDLYNKRQMVSTSMYGFKQNDLACVMLFIIEFKVSNTKPMDYRQTKCLMFKRQRNYKLVFCSMIITLLSHNQYCLCQTGAHCYVSLKDRCFVRNTRIMVNHLCSNSIVSNEHESSIFYCNV